jgi:hypothetical protein
VQYQLTRHQTGAIILQTAASNVLNIDTNIVKATNKLPDVADVNSTGIGVQYNFNNMDYRFNPRRGNDVSFTGSFGQKNIKKNSTIQQIKDPGFDVDNLYDSVKLHSYQVRMQGSATKYFPLGKQAAFKLAINAGWYQTPDYFQNELFRIEDLNYYAALMKKVFMRIVIPLQQPSIIIYLAGTHGFMVLQMLAGRIIT